MSTSAPPCAVVGRGRLGTALAAALRAGGVAVEGPLGRDETPALSDRSMADADRVAYHAAASMASNFLVTLEGASERLAATAGVDRAALAPLVRQAVDNWAARGAAEALTGPIARGDEETVAAQRAVVVERTPELTTLFDALAERTRALALEADGAASAREAVVA